MQGKLITFEGSEGSGKSTQIELAYRYLKARKKKVLLLREPGGVRISEEIRNILLNVKNKTMGRGCETLLYMASRAELVDQVIRPALSRGTIVLCDRFLDSTFAYQGYGYGVDLKTIKVLGDFATGGIKPDLTFLFDIETKEGFSRIRRARDRIERRPLDYHRRVRQGYLKLAKEEPERIKVIRATQTKEEIEEIVRREMERLLE